MNNVGKGILWWFVGVGLMILTFHVIGLPQSDDYALWPPEDYVEGYLSNAAPWVQWVAASPHIAIAVLGLVQGLGLILYAVSWAVWLSASPDGRFRFWAGRLSKWFVLISAGACALSVLIWLGLYLAVDGVFLKELGLFLWGDVGMVLDGTLRKALFAAIMGTGLVWVLTDGLPRQIEDRRPG